MTKYALITFSEAGNKLAQKLIDMGFEGNLILPDKSSDTHELFSQYEALIYIGALGICVRHIAPHLKSKQTDPAIINIDVNGRFVQPVTGGHVGGANALSS